MADLRILIHRPLATPNRAPVRGFIAPRSHPTDGGEGGRIASGADGTDRANNSVTTGLDLVGNRDALFSDAPANIVVWQTRPAAGYWH